LLLAVFILPLSAAAQTADRLTDTTVIRLGFSYNYDTYVWTDSLLFRRQLGNRTFWGLDGGLSATEISSSDGLTRKQRFVSGGMFIDHRFSSRWLGGINLTQRRHRLEELANRHFVFSDILARLVYSISPTSSLTQKTGFSAAGRSASGAETEDFGFTSETALLLDGYRLGDIAWRSHGSLRINDLENIPSVEGRWGISTGGTIPFGDTLAVFVEDLIRRTRYYPNANEYETIAEQKLRNGLFEANAGGRWGTGLDWGLITNFSWRKETYELAEMGGVGAPVLPLGLRQTSQGYRLKLGGRLGLFGGITAGYRYGESNEDFGANVKDQDSKTGELNLSAYCRVGDADSVSMRVLWKLVSFFVPPDSGFFTDRDLGTRLAEVGWTHRFSAEWETAVLFSYRGIRQVFISGRWSGDNNRNDIYLFEPRLRWNPAPGWRVDQTYRIQANYLSYDVEKGEPQPERSTLYRRGESQTRLWLAPVHYAHVDVRYTYRYEDFGPLIWREKWNQQVSWDRRSHLAGISWHLVPYRGWEVVPGFSFEQKKAYNHIEVNGDMVREPRSTFVRRRGELAVTWRPSGGRDDLRLSGSRRVQKSGTGRKDISDWVELSYRRYW